MARCKAIKSDGNRCRTEFGLASDGLCWHHSPEYADQRRRASSQGGKVAARKRHPTRTVTAEEVPPAPSNVEEAVAFASWALTAVVTGRIDAGTARTAGYLCRAFIDGRKHIDSVDARVKELGEKIKQLKEAS